MSLTFRRAKLCAAVMAACGGGALGSGTAIAQQTPSGTQQLERVEVTGSRIRRLDAETAAPVTIVTREEIEKSGRSTVAEYLQTLSFDNQGSVPTGFGNGFAAGASGISLRGLGAASTLVLINGRRVAPYGFADDGQKVFTDVNVIPLELVERVEILRDGGSAIYGSDAIAGVVNVILRRDFKGVVVGANYGVSEEGDGDDTRAFVAAGFGDLTTDKFNVFFSFEARKQSEIYNRDRSDRDHIGRGDLRNEGYGLTGNFFGGTGAVLDNNLAGSPPNGNVRNPTTLDYYNRGDPAGVGFTRFFPAAACANFSTSPQNLPLGGCLFDASQQYTQIQPEIKSQNFFTRGTWQFDPNVQAYGEFTYYNNEYTSSTTPSGVSGSVGYPGGPVNNGVVALGAAHPDNPYFGTAARLRYLAADVGPRVSNVDTDFTRFVAGLKGTFGSWDFDTAYLFSKSETTNVRTGFLQRDVAFALLNPTAANVAAATAGSAAYAALPPGTFWRIGENAGLNSAALYAALSPSISADSEAETQLIDFKVSRELGQLAGGPMGLALGAEYRKESMSLTPQTGTERGNIIGLGYSAYDGDRNVTALYAELAAPVLKELELSAAIRYDHYSDVGNSWTPKFGVKYTPVRQLLLRGTYSRGFRAPSAPENGTGGLAFFTAADDPLRCALGVAAACDPGQVAGITSPNPALEPETSDNYSLGLVFEPTANTSIALDYWSIKRKNEINQEETTAAIAAGSVVRDPSSATAIPGDPGPIIAVLARFINSATTKVDGIDLDARQRFDLPESWGRLTFDLKWTHIFKFERTEKDGSSRDFAGSHGNCDVSNCIGTPDDRANLTVSWDYGAWRVATIMNYRGSIENKFFKDDPDGCASHFDDGTEAPPGCKLSSFTTFDLTARYQAMKNLEIFGSILNLFDKVAPLDPLTYGAVSFNPLDYRGAVGRFYSIGARYKFF